MLKDILKAISEGKTTVPEIAKTLDMEESAVVNAIKELRLKGCLTTIFGCARNSPFCRSCPLAKELPEMGITHCITEKGMKYLKK